MFDTELTTDAYHVMRIMKVNQTTLASQATIACRCSVADEDVQ